MAKSNAKQIDQADDTMLDNTEQAQTVVPESINLSDLANLLQIVDLATQRGAFRGNELSQVGAVFDKLNAFLSYIQEQQITKSSEAGE
jgi:hypothetical protein